MFGRGARQAENEEALAIQTNLLAHATPRGEGFETASAWQPSTEVSGDYFDVFPLSGGRMAVCVADVAGKGMIAAKLMGQLQSAVQTFAPDAASPAQLCTKVNQALCETTAPGAYVTMFYGVLDQAGKRLHYENAGHCLPVLVRGDGSVEFPASFSGVLGLFSHWLYQDQEIALGSGDTLLLVTDGVIEAEGRRGEEFGYQRLIAIAQNGRARNAQALSEEILKAVSNFCRNRFSDDASLVVVRVS